MTWNWKHLEVVKSEIPAGLSEPPDSRSHLALGWELAMAASCFPMPQGRTTLRQRHLGRTPPRSIPRSIGLRLGPSICPDLQH